MFGSRVKQSRGWRRERPSSGRVYDNQCQASVPQQVWDWWRPYWFSSGLLGGSRSGPPQSPSSPETPSGPGKACALVCCKTSRPRPVPSHGPQGPRAGAGRGLPSVPSVPWALRPPPAWLQVRAPEGRTAVALCGFRCALLVTPGVPRVRVPPARPRRGGVCSDPSPRLARDETTGDAVTEGGTAHRPSFRRVGLQTRSSRPPLPLSLSGTTFQRAGAGDRGGPCFCLTGVSLFLSAGSLPAKPGSFGVPIPHCTGVTEYYLKILTA